MAVIAQVRHGDEATVAPLPRPADRALGLGLIALGAALAVNTVLGPLAADVVAYPFSESIRNQTMGLEVVSFALVTPLCIAAGILVLQGATVGAVLAIGPATYTAYMMVQYVVGPGYPYYPPVLIFHLALFVLSWLLAVRAWVSFRPGDLPMMTARSRRRRAVVLSGLAAFVMLRYVPAFIGSVGSEALTDEFAADPAFFWTILLMDVGIVVPCLVATAVALRRGAPSATKSTYALVCWFALVPPSVAAMAVAMVINDDPNASVASTVLFVAAACVFAVYAVALYRPLLRTGKVVGDAGGPAGEGG